ncbi:TPA: lysis protein [Escherichia coli]|uniref:lysis protein n=1 Tax=Escherichia coli TaxID=562 RepID=UPI000DA591B8|nr:lysis protein [Escherichia coli]EES9562136.1 lysis protein [Escherichia coli]EET9653855.1 lysis protein [Escherichia coli]EEU1619641.1 lysis protein [Escherichia coli]EEV9790832.1 lysis protein [Escherichia coli]EEW1326620.1 lysis protein [Escherichia coli]
MSISMKSLIVPGVILLLVLASWLFYGSYQSERKRADDAEQSLALASATIKDMQNRQRDAVALDAKYTKDLADAKKQLDDLQRCVSSGKCGLHVNAKCPANGTTSTGGLGDASSPRLTDSAERDYFTLRERIETVTKQVGYLQDYIKEQCLK